MKKYKKRTYGLEKRYVYGSRDNKWHLVDGNDRDWYYGVTKEEFKRLGKKAATEKYVSPSLLGRL